MLLYKSVILSSIIYKHPSIIPILNRFEIKLGVGELCIAEIAKSHNLDVDFLLMVLNTYLNEDYFPDIELNEITTEQIVEYIEKTNRYYLEIQLPNIEKHLTAFIGMSMAMGGPKAHLGALGELLRQLRVSLDQEIDGVSEVENNPLSLLKEMQEIMIKFLSGNYNLNLCYATIFALKSLESDIERHLRIKERILHPIIECEREGKKFVGKKGEREEKILTPREIEVLKLIVAGKLNKEIADDLDISFQTVLSHRKNITSKLGIKTVSGLTFYAIINGIVEVEIK
jgi:Response regulator containing a CheY-like receiver domain and an HTH DNA-binding domain